MSRDMTKPTKWVCAQRRHRSARASAQSDQSLRCAYEENVVLSCPLSASEDSDQTGRMPRLIWVFAGRTVTFLVLSCRGSYIFTRGVETTTDRWLCFAFSLKRFKMQWHEINRYDLYLRNRSALVVNCWVIIHCLEVSCKVDQITSAKREWFIYLQLIDKQWFITQQFTH